jgi:hypothetical protein
VVTARARAVSGARRVAIGCCAERKNTNRRRTRAPETAPRGVARATIAARSAAAVGSDAVCASRRGGFARVAFVGVAFACRRGVSGAHAPRIVFGGVEAFRRRDDGERGRGGVLVARGALLGRDARGAGLGDAHVRGLSWVWVSDTAGRLVRVGAE